MESKYPGKPGDTNPVEFLKSWTFSRKTLVHMSVWLKMWEGRMWPVDSWRFMVSKSSATFLYFTVTKAICNKCFVKMSLVWKFLKLFYFASRPAEKSVILYKIKSFWIGRIDGDWEVGWNEKMHCEKDIGMVTYRKQLQSNLFAFPYKWPKPNAPMRQVGCYSLWFIMRVVLPFTRILISSELY